jgi:uncharacterized protein (DUF58 family)
MPSLSYSGRFAFAGAVGLSLGGLLGGVGTVALAGSAVLTGIAFAWALTVHLPRKMRRERLEFTWWMPVPAGSVRRPHEPVTLRIALRNPTDETLFLGSPRLSLSSGLRHARSKGARVEVPPGAVATFDLVVRPSYAGRHVLHGAWMTLAGPLGLAWAPLYFPNPLILEVQPRGMGLGSKTNLRSRTDRVAALRSGRTERRAGEGAEIRELREHQPGDPIRRIAWAASGRRGKLLVRETEDESQTTRVMIVDASSTMRGDERGAAKIDYAIEMVAQAARLCMSAGDRLGLVGFDRRVVTRVQPGDGPAHIRRVVSSAIELRSLVDDDLTDVDDDTLIDTVARYFREQEGVDVFAGVHPSEGKQTLARMATKAIGNDPSARLPVRAGDAMSRLLRTFCRVRQIPLPLRYDTEGREKAEGLAKALRAAVEGAREVQTIVVVSDLDAIEDFEPVKRALGIVRQKRHRLTFVVPTGFDFVGNEPAEQNATEKIRREALVDLFTTEEKLRVDEMRQRLAVAGVPLYMAGIKDPVARWLKRSAAPVKR